MEKYGFVYIWFDKKRRMFYIGSHWGTEDDGYICSSNRMRNVHTRRPQDFKRRIISKVFTNRKDLLKEEQRWLNFIKPDEKRMRYYNLNLDVLNPWWADEDAKMTVGQKISTTAIRNGKHKGRKISEEQKQLLSKLKKGNKNSLGMVHTEEAKDKMRIAAKSQPNKTCECCGKEVSSSLYNLSHGPRCGRPMMTPEQRLKISLAKKGKPGTNKGRKFTPEQKANMSRAQQGRKHSDETRTKMSDSKKGKMSEIVKQAWADGKYQNRRKAA